VSAPLGRGDLSSGDARRVFTAHGAGTFSVDDVEVDPWRSC
jgi:hypothetical protein